MRPRDAGGLIRFGVVGAVCIEVRDPARGERPRDARNAVYVADGGRTLIVEPTAPAWLIAKLWPARVAAAQAMLAGFA